MTTYYADMTPRTRKRGVPSGRGSCADPKAYADKLRGDDQFEILVAKAIGDFDRGGDPLDRDGVFGHGYDLGDERLADVATAVVTEAIERRRAGKGSGPRRASQPWQGSVQELAKHARGVMRDPTTPVEAVLQLREILDAALGGGEKRALWLWDQYIDAQERVGGRAQP
jgi:hypothetical protein